MTSRTGSNAGSDAGCNSGPDAGCNSGPDAGSYEEDIESLRRRWRVRW